MALASASRTTGHGLGLGGQVLGLGRRVLGLGKHVLGLKYFSVLWLKLTVNFITNFENLAVKMKLVFTSPAINVCVLKFWLNSEPYWHWPWHRPALALEAKSLALRAVALSAKALSTLATIVADFGDYSRQCGHWTGLKQSAGAMPTLNPT